MTIPYAVPHIHESCPGCGWVYCQHDTCEGVVFELSGWNCVECGHPLLRADADNAGLPEAQEMTLSGREELVEVGISL